MSEGKWLVTIDGEHEFRIEADTQAEAEALAVRQFARERDSSSPAKGRVTGSKPA